MRTTSIKNEYLLQYIWNLRLIPQRGIFTRCKREIRIIHPGHLNLNDGPDFMDAEILIDNEIWFGHVEIHINSSDWITHGHHQDPRYKNVILHVVLDDDCEICYPDGSKIPTLEIRQILPKNFTSTYLALIYNSKKLPCSDLQAEVSQLHFSKWMETLAIERMEEKVTRFLNVLESESGNWEESIYKSLFISLGGKINKQGFDTLSDSLPLRLIRHHSHNLQELEILLLGQAGMLNLIYDKYGKQNVNNTFNHFKIKYELDPMRPQTWLKKGIRPANQPGLRIKQFCKLLHGRQNFMEALLDLRNENEFKSYFQWNTDDKKINTKYAIGDTTIDIILINSIAPILFAYGKKMQIQYYCERAINLWNHLQPEKNRITRLWNSLGRVAFSALESQAMNQLDGHYCKFKRCHQCAIGHFIMKKSEIEDKQELYKIDHK